MNDQILEVNSISLVGVTQQFAAQTLKSTSGVVKFLMGREKSRRPYFTPGAQGASPDMEALEAKHREEIQEILTQLEDAELRAKESSDELEDVRITLLEVGI